MNPERFNLDRVVRHRIREIALMMCPIVCAAVMSSPVGRASEPGAGGGKSADDNYGRTPSAVMPYREFQEPYVRFFTSTTKFLGYGREAGLSELPETVRIGVLAPTGSAPDADLGQEMIDGITLAIEQANANGGYQNVPFEMVIRQDAGLWGSTAQEMVAFKFNDHVVGVLGSIDGANTHIALRVALKAQLPIVNTATTDPTLTETAIPWLIRCMADDRQQGYALAHHIFGDRGFKKVAALRVNDRFGRTGIAEFRDAARRLRYPLRVELRWDRGDRDFGKQLDRIAQTGAEAIVLWGNATDAAAVVREIRRRDMPLAIFGCDRIVSRRFLEEAGAAANGVVGVATHDPTAPNLRYKGFRDAFEDRFDREPDAFAAHAYDGANMLLDSIRKSGLNPILVRDAIYEYEKYDGVTGLIEFDPTLNDIGPVHIATVKEGEFVFASAGSSKSAQTSQSVSPYRALADSPPVVRVAGSERARGAYRIGCFLPLDSVGKSVADGVRMALEEDAGTNRQKTPIELIVRDSRGVWTDNSSALTKLVVEEEVLALVGSTDRKGTHFIETIAAKFHLPLIALCADDPTVHAIPLPWVFSVAPPEEVANEEFSRRFERRYGGRPEIEAAMGYDAGRLLVTAIRTGGTTSTQLRDRLAAAACSECGSGSFQFDSFGRRVKLGELKKVAATDETFGVMEVTRGDDGAETAP